MIHHIKHLKRHRNILYGFILILIAVQIVSFITLSSQISQVQSSQLSLRKTVGESIDDIRQDNQYKINEVVKELSNQKEDVQKQLVSQEQLLQKQLSLIQTSQQDFSKVFSDVIKGVVSVGTDKTAGTGFFVHAAGYVITNNHVIQGAQFVKITTYDNKVYDATVVGVDGSLDLALLKVNGIFFPLKFVETNVKPGDKVIAIGNPLGLSFSVTEGIVSALNREGPNGLKSYIQTDVTLNPGNSGGPLINNEGKVVGVNNFKLGNAEGLGFALQADKVKEFITQLSKDVTPLNSYVQTSP